MVKLLMRFYNVTDGKILIDGNNINDYKRSDLRHIFGMVLQDTWLFSGTIMDNLRYGKLDATDDEVIEAAKKAHVHHFIQTLPDSYNMELNEETNNISQGQKQLLTIARAILANPKVLILDEATTGLDPVVRDEILDLFLDFIQDESHAIFFSSHITSDIQKIADYVILIHQGKVIFEEQKDDLVYHYGILKCRRSEFASLSPDDYLISRQSNTGIECLVKDREMVKGKYKNMIVDNATLEDIMLFYIKGGIPCEG